MRAPLQSAMHFSTCAVYKLKEHLKEIGDQTLTLKKHNQ